MKQHECEIDTKRAASAQTCLACGRHWLKLDNGSWRVQNRADRRASSRGYRALRRAQALRFDGHAAAVAKVRAARRGYGAKRARRAAAEA